MNQAQKHTEEKAVASEEGGGGRGREKEEKNQMCATKHFSYFTLNSWAPFVKRRKKTFSIF